MAAHGDTNKPKCKTNVNNDEDRDFALVYKTLEQVLNSKSEQFEKKVESLIEAWKQVYHYSNAVKDLYFVQLMDWAKFHTLNVVLNGDWKNYKDVYEEKLLCEVRNTEKALLKLNNLFSLRCKKLAEVIKDPWGNPILNRLLNNPDAYIGPKEIEFFCLETGYLVSHRLKKLCEQHCEDLALNFVSAFIRCLNLAESQQFNLNTTEQQKWFIMDIYIALLFKYKKFPQLLTALKEMSLSEGYELVKRFTNKRVKISKVWRHSHKIAQMACQIFVTSSVMAPLEEGGEKLRQLLEIWFSYNENDASLDTLGDSIRRIVHAAESAEQMYIICDALHKKFDTRAKTILVELLIRSLTTDMNRLENLKHEENVEEETKTKTRMSSAFDKLSRILEEKIEVARECALTGFSLTPTEERLKIIEDFARKSGCNVDETTKEWTCRLHPPTLPSDEVTWQCDACGGYMSQPKLEAALNTTNTLLCEALRPEKLGLDPLLCDDLAVLLSSPKYHLLSWLLSWPDLHRMCVMYLRDPQSIKNIVSVLEYAEPDYSLYMRPIKQEPIDEDDIHTGIEKGYEHFLLPSPEESLSETESSPSENVSFQSPQNEVFFPHFAAFLAERSPQRKNQTNTSKLRQFRKHLKRPVEMPKQQFPEKLLRFEEKKIYVPPPPVHRITGVGFWDDTGRYHPDKPSEHDSPEDLSVSRPEPVPIKLQKDLCDEFEEFLASVHTAPVNNYIKNVNIQADCDDFQQKTDNNIVVKVKDDSTENKTDIIDLIDIVDSPEETKDTQNSNTDFIFPDNKSEVVSTTSARETDDSDVKPKITSELEKLLNEPVQKQTSLLLQTQDVSKKITDIEEKQPIMKLKEATVILNRINIKQYLNRKLRRRTVSDTESTENNNEIRYPVVDKAPQGSFPLQDKNPRVETKRERSVECKKSIRKAADRRRSGRRKKRPVKKPEKDMKWHIPKNSSFSSKTLDQLLKSPKVILEKLRLDDARIKKSVLANVPGLNDLELIQPECSDRVVQVVQVSGGRQTSTVTSQNSQTSTQITPHIQRVGQPRNDKPGPVSENAETSAVTTTTSEKPARSQPSTLINILSHQVITPAQTRGNRINILSHHLINPADTTKTNATTSQVNSTTIGDQQLANSSTAKTPVASQTTDQNRILQFICKSTDGKLIPVTSFTPNRVVKLSTTQAGSGSSAVSNYEFGKQKTNDELDGAETLPKFQQAFGKSAYQNNVDNNIDDKKVVKTTASSVVQGSVIYTRQMPVGQTINLIPPGRGQVFRIATSNSDPTVIHSKMSALLAAALQGKPKNSETTETETIIIEDSNSSGSRSTLTTTQIVKPVLNVATTRNNLSSTTLEQLREFDMVYKQVKERSSTNTGVETTTTTTITTTTETSEPQRMNVTYVGQGQKFTQISPVVVVSSYSLQPAASPALSVTSQGSSSPCVTPAITPSLPKVTPKNSKGKTVKSTTTHTSKTSPIPKPQQKPQEDEHTTQRIFDILAEYAEQLRNSPDLNNKPAPRRRSNPPTNPNQNSKRKKNNTSKKSGQCSSTISSDADIEDPRTIGSEDSSCGVVQISMQEDEQTTATTQTGEASNETLILADASHNQTRNLIIADSSVGEALKMPSTAVLVPGNYIMPVSMVKGGQQIAVVSGGSKILATVPARSGPNMLLFQSFLNQNRKAGIPTVKYSAIQPISGISSSSIAGVSAQPPVVLPPTSHSLSAVALGQPISIKKINEQNNTELLLAISQPQFTTETNNIQPNNNNQNISSDKELPRPVENTFQKSLITAPIATSVISQTVSLKEDQQQQQEHSEIQNVTIPPTTEDVSKGDSSAKIERVQSVLVTASSSNGPMLANSSPVTTGPKPYKTEFFRIVEMQSPDTKQQFQANVTYYNRAKRQTQQQATPQKQERDVSLQRKQAAMERELRLQKSLSEECEDLGVDEPSTSDLFPEADLLFDNNQSPSFEQITPKRAILLPEINKEESKLFSGDDSSSVGANLLFEPIEYASPDTVFEYGPPNQVSNGQGSTSNDTGSSCEDNTMLHHCTTMSDMTLNSPAGDDPYLEQQPSANKYKYKYSNRKKLERHKQPESWPHEASSSEDTTGSTEMKRSSHSPEMCSNKRGCEETDKEKDEEECENSVCGRGARRIAKKSSCSCCNGAGELPVSRKRTAAQLNIQAPHKKAFLSKKR